jgi:hypothetical protein
MQCRGLRRLFSKAVGGVAQQKKRGQRRVLGDCQELERAPRNRCPFPFGLVVFRESDRGACDKARSSATFRRPTKVFEDAVAGGRVAILGLGGATSPQDGQVARAGLNALK